MKDKSQTLPEDVYEYLLSVSLREADELTELREKIQALPGAHMAIPPEQGQLLQFLLKLLNGKRVLEVGMFAGYGSLAMALALPDEGELITCEINPEHQQLAEFYWQKAQVQDRIKLQTGAAKDTLAELKNQGKTDFDLAFIDADKANYNTYYEQCLCLVRAGGIVAIDNVLRMGRWVQHDDGTRATQVIRELNKKIHEDKRVDIVTLPVGGGMTLARKKQS